MSTLESCWQIPWAMWLFYGIIQHQVCFAVRAGYQMPFPWAGGNCGRGFAHHRVAWKNAWDPSRQWNFVTLLSSVPSLAECSFPRSRVESGQEEMFGTQNEFVWCLIMLGLHSICESETISAHSISNMLISHLFPRGWSKLCAEFWIWERVVRIGGWEPMLNVYMCAYMRVYIHISTVYIDTYTFETQPVHTRKMFASQTTHQS